MNFCKIYGTCWKKFGKIIFFGIAFLLFFVLFVTLPFYWEISLGTADEYLFSKMNYIKIDKWEKEIIEGQTHYVIMFGNKTIVVSPLDYPEVRNINSNTKTKILPHTNVNLRGFLQINMLEKN